ncbi:uncharacterized protein SETTUDRAFT_38886 [Exserohilum turcica Et28A]|uniref:Uncharacterized protein n=1 Tax=Exserohilum turcicum (strain 28A) TaxID=671987 RepID=R0KFZ0_EXST2|nr:uncharacterized protein SETTUDRAFT_38886 [Exserohilum turcica Et28A]EOA88214.1 hypothetical protein SETTUDRAFT_38886 [Exserohilum turcica Et28A]
MPGYPTCPCTLVQSAYDPTRSAEQGGPSQQPERKSGGNGWKYAAAGAAGLAGGALLMHESDKIEEGFDHAKENVENFPENAAQWTGEKVQAVEDFPEDAAEWTGEKVQAVEDIPDRIENKWDGMVGGVEQWGDNMQEAYDYGKEERRYEDDDY